jgi:hypothetical protein
LAAVTTLQCVVWNIDAPEPTILSESHESNGAHQPEIGLAFKRIHLDAGNTEKRSDMGSLPFCWATTHRIRCPTGHSFTEKTGYPANPKTDIRCRRAIKRERGVRADGERAGVVCGIAGGDRQAGASYGRAAQDVHRACGSRDDRGIHTDPGEGPGARAAKRQCPRHAIEPDVEIAALMLDPLPLTVAVVVEKVEPAPATNNDRAVLFVNAPVITASPPFCTASVFPAARFTSPPELRVSCEPSSVRLSLMLKTLVPATAIVELLLKTSADPSAPMLSVPSAMVISCSMSALGDHVITPPPCFTIAVFLLSF